MQKKWIQETESDLRNNRYFKSSEARKHTFNELAERYIKAVLPNKKTACSQEAQLKWWKGQIGGKTSCKHYSCINFPIQR